MRLPLQVGTDIVKYALLLTESAPHRTATLSTPPLSYSVFNIFCVTRKASWLAGTVGRQSLLPNQLDSHILRCAGPCRAESSRAGPPSRGIA